MIQHSSVSDIDAFANFLTYEKRYSVNTIIAYQNDLKSYKDFLAITYDDLSILESKHLHIRSWLVSMNELNLVPRSINRKISSLRSFFNYHIKGGLAIKNPTLKIVTPKVGKRLPEYLHETKIESLFDTIDNQGFIDYRNRLIIELFYITGMRRIELINIKQNDIDYNNRVVKVLGKGNKERVIPLSKNFLEKIELYIERKEEYYDGVIIAENLFITNKGKTLYPKLVYNIVKKYLSTITTAAKRSPHVLRHTFATHMMNGGADLNAVKELLGHANLAATQIYTHNSIEKLKEVYKKAHPKSENK